MNSNENRPTSEANNYSVNKFSTFYGGKMFLIEFAIEPALNQINPFHPLRCILIIYLHLDIPGDPISSAPPPKSCMHLSPSHSAKSPAVF
jgi:hypothetical protein